MGTIKVPTAEDNWRKVKALPWIGECLPTTDDTLGFSRRQDLSTA